MIIHGEALSVLRSLEAASFDALITDPPYSSGGMYRGDRMQSTRDKYTATDHTGASTLPSFGGDNRDGRSFTSWCAEWLTESYRVLKEGAPVAIFADWRQVPSVTDALQWGGFIWRGVALWIKPNARPQKGRFTQQAEFIVWGSKGRMPLERGVPGLPGSYTYPPPTSARRAHQTEKPLELMRALVKITEPGGHILDPFAGSGTTNVAAVLEGYECTGIELDAHFAGIARKREQEGSDQHDQG